jgi:hypothetical protein
MQLDLAALKHSSNGYAELFAAIRTFTQTLAMRFASKNVVLSYTSTVRAYNTIAPA